MKVEADANAFLTNEEVKKIYAQAHVAGLSVKKATEVIKEAGYDPKRIPKADFDNVYGLFTAKEGE